MFNESANFCNNNNNTSATTKTYKGHGFDVSVRCHVKPKYHLAKKRHAKYPSTASKAYSVASSKKY